MAQDPGFVAAQVEKYYSERVQKYWDGGHIMAGRAPGPQDIVMMSNDYLDIGGDDSIACAEAAVLRDVGHGSPTSRVFANHYDNPHCRFEKRMAEFVGAEDATLFSSGYDANVGAMECFTVPGHPVYVDTMAHASLWKGCVSAGADVVRVRHNDVSTLRRLVMLNGPGTVVVDSLYSTDGSICPLAEYVDACHRLGCFIVVDETHAFGVQGPKGRGLTAAHGLSDQVHLQVVSLAKSVACRGGIVLGSKRNIEYMRYTAFPAIFSSQVMAHEVAGYDAALSLVQGADEQRQRLADLHRMFRRGLDEIGYNVKASKAQIIAVESGDEHTTIKFRDYTQDRGLFGSVFCAPATAKNRSMIRFTLNASVTNEEIERAIDVLSDAFRDLNAAKWPSTRRKHSRTHPLSAAA